jgi:cytosolic 5'-nucleotidase 3
LHAKYYPLEVDRSLSLEDRIKFMVEWVEQSHAAMLTSGLTRSKLIAAVADANIALRDGHDVLLHHLETLSIPLLIFSAGIADVLEEVFKQHSEAPLPQHAHIVSNRMVFNEQSGALESFTEDLFHVFNKQASSIQHAPYFQADGIDKRHNVILVGDSLGDVHMATVSTAVIESILACAFCKFMNPLCTAVCYNVAYSIVAAHKLVCAHVSISSVHTVHETL